MRDNTRYSFSSDMRHQKMFVVMKNKWLLAATLVILLGAAVVGLQAVRSMESVTPTSVVRLSKPSSLELLWTYNTTHFLNGSPLAADGTLYIVGSDVDSSYESGWRYYLRALDIFTGRLKWTLAGYEYPPAVADGVIYSGANGELHAIDIKTREVRWTFKTDVVTRNLPFVTNDVEFAPTIADGVIYFGSGDTLYAVDVDTGFEWWRSKYADTLASPIVDGDIVYFIAGYIRMAPNSDVVDHEGSLYAVRRQNGQLLWKFQPPPGLRGVRTVSSIISAHDGIVYCTTDYVDDSNPGYIYALEGKTGKELWKRSPGDGLWPGSSPPTLHGGALYITDGRDSLYALDARSGGERWRFTGTKFLSDNPVVAEGVIYITSVDGIVFGIDAESGWELGRFEAEKGLYLTAVLADGIPYFVGRKSDGIYVFRLPE